MIGATASIGGVHSKTWRIDGTLLWSG